MIYVSCIHCTLSNVYTDSVGNNFFLVGRSFITLEKSQLQEGGLLKHQIQVPNDLSFNTRRCAKSTKNEFSLIQIGRCFKAIFEMLQYLLS